MSTAGHTPNFVAEEAIYPFRVVQFGTQAFSLLQATQSDQVLAGVTDGSVQGFNATTHATAGQVCSLQNGEFVQVTAGDTIVPSDLLVATTDGKVIPAQLGSTEAILQAAEAAEDGEIFWAKKIGAWTLGGGVSPITAAGWPDPDNKSVWMTDFIETNAPLFSAAQGSGETVPYVYGGMGSSLALPDPGSASHPGVLTIAAMATGAKMRVGMIEIPGWDASNMRVSMGPSEDYEFKAIVSPFLYLSSSDNSYLLHIGYTAATESSDNFQGSFQGVFFRYTHTVNSGRWQCGYNLRNTATGGDEMFWVDSGVAVAVDWVNLKAEIINSGSGSRPVLQWTIDGTLVATVDMNALDPKYELSNPLVAASSIVATGTVDLGTALMVDYMHSVTYLDR